MLNFTHWTLSKTPCKQNRLLRNPQHGHVFPWLLKIVPVFTDLQNELKDYAKDEQITIGSERYLSDERGEKKSLQP